MTLREQLELIVSQTNPWFGAYWYDQCQCMWDREGVWFDQLKDDWDMYWLAHEMKMVVDFNDLSASHSIGESECAQDHDNSLNKAIVALAVKIATKMKEQKEQSK